MTLSIKKVRIQGIRGFNNPEELDLARITLLHGPNGSGKSSVLQALEWGITGSISSMKGGDFSKEDAFVNLFSRSKKGSVEIQLENQGKKITLQRTRKRGTRTSTGKQPLELNLNGNSYSDDAADEKLEETFGFPISAFASSKYLHQETIRDILEAKPEERSKAIEKILGTIEIREFASGLDFDTQIKKSANELRRLEESLESDKVQFAVNLGRQLAATRDTLMSKGLTETDLSLANAVYALKRAEEKASELADSYGLDSVTVDITPQAKTLGDAHTRLSQAVYDLNQARLHAVNLAQTEREALSKASELYSSAYNSLKGLGEVDPKTLKGQLYEIEGKLKKISADLMELRTKLSQLPSRRVAYETAKTQLEGKLVELRVMNPGLTDEVAMKNRVTGIRGEIDKLYAETLELRQKLSILTTRRTAYADANTLFKGRMDSWRTLNQDVDSLEPEKRIDEIENEMQEIEKTAKALREKLTQLPHKRTRYQSLRSQLDSENAKLGELVSKQGSLEEVRVKAEEAERGAEEQSQEQIKLQGHQRLLVLAIENLETTHSEKCPICKQSIDNTKLLGELRSMMGEEIKEKIQAHKKEEGQLKQLHNALLKLAQQIERAQASVYGLTSEVDAAAGELRVLIPDFDKHQLDGIVKEWEKAVGEAGSRKDSLQAEKDIISRVIVLRKNLKTSEEALRKIVPDFEKLDLDEVSKEWGLKVQENESKTQSLTVEKELIEAVYRLEASLNKTAEDLRRIIEDFEHKDLDVVMKQWDTELKKHAEEETSLKGKEKTIQATLSQLEALTRDVETHQARLRKATGTNSDGPSLVTEAENILARYDAKTVKLGDAKAVEALRGSLEGLTEVIAYLKEAEKVEASEKELPAVKNQIEEINAKRISLEMLAASLSTIRGFTLQYQKEAAQRAFDRMEVDLNRFYDKIQGHPYFSRLKIELEREDPLIYSIKAVGGEEDTYIPTRFSTAQLNVAALSIFLSNSSQQAGDLPLVILDDPTQNMDSSHKEAFAKLASEIAVDTQVIIATQDDETRRLLEEHCKDMRLYEFKTWTPEGPEVESTQ